MSCFPVCLSWLVVKEYITVSQLSQIFGMQRVDPSSSSSLPSFQLASSETNFSCQSTACGPYTILSAQVCSRQHSFNFHAVMSARTILFAMLALCLSLILWLGAIHHLRVSLSCAGMQCLLLTLNAGTRTSWLLESLSPVLRPCLQSLFPHADRGR